MDIDSGLRASARIPDQEVGGSDLLGDELEFAAAEGDDVEDFRIAHGDPLRPVGGLDEDRFSGLHLELQHDVLVGQRSLEADEASIPGRRERPGLGAALARDRRLRHEQGKEGECQ